MRASFLWFSVLIVCGLSLSGASAHAGTFPEPSKYPISWELKFTHAQPKRVVVNLPDKGAVAYWYMTYNVANLGDTEQQFLPMFEMVTNEGKVIPSDFAVPDKVFQKIKSAEGNDLLERMPRIAGAIRVGEDQSKDGVAIWQEPESRMGDFQIFVSGLSGEAVSVKDADNKPQTDADGNPMILHKTFEMDFVIYGDELYPDKDEVHAKTEKWVMR
jgi:hypothetical protein